MLHLQLFLYKYRFFFAELLFLFYHNKETLAHLGPVVQSIVSLTSSLRGQLIKCFMTVLNTLIFFVEKMQKLLTSFQQKNIGIF